MRPITERLSPTIRNLIVVMAVVFGLYTMAAGLRPFFTAHLALGPAVAMGELWQPLTSLFVHLDLWGFVFDLIGLWFVGATVERSLGRGRFLLIFFGAGLLANIVVALLLLALAHPSIYAGCGDSVLALFVAFGVLFGRTQVRVFGSLALQARILSLILVGMSLISALAQAAWPSLAGTVVAIAVGYFLSGGSGRSILDAFAHLRRHRSRLGVLEGGRGRGSKKYVN